MDTNVIKVAVDAIRGKCTEFSADETSAKLRNALIQANGGSTKLNPKTFYRGSDVFSIVEEILPVIVDEAIRADHEYLNWVDYRNIANGDENSFVAKKNSLVVATAADGISMVRRQRLGEGTRVNVPTFPKTLRVYDELSRFMAGYIDFDEMLSLMTTAMQNAARYDAVLALQGITDATPGLNSNLVMTGSYDETTLLNLVQRVEAMTGSKARILGDIAALRKITTAVVADSAKEDMYNIGHYGKFNGTEMIRATQMFKPGTETFALDGKTIYVFASDDKFIKQVNEGSGYLAYKDSAVDNADATQEIVYNQMWGTGVICAEAIGVYTMS